MAEFFQSHDITGSAKINPHLMSESIKQNYYKSIQTVGWLRKATLIAISLGALSGPGCGK